MFLLKKFLPSAIKIFLLENRYFFSIDRLGLKRDLMNRYIYNDFCELNIDSVDKWINKFIKLICAFPNLQEVAEEFFDARIEVITENIIPNSAPIAICIQKNDCVKIQQFIRHHRMLGFKHFVILDNDSTDGSFEWLKKQSDVVLLKTETPYTTNRREAWINRIMAHYGDERWYYVADSDEFLVYDDCEHKSINDVIEFYEKKKIVRARAMMLDMYATPDFYAYGNISDFYDNCVFFDKDTYRKNPREYMDLVCGGPRERVFKESPWLTKYPLFYLRKKDLECKSHFLFPLKDNIKTDCHLLLKHYKFQPGELEKYRTIVKEGNYFNGSKQYIGYLKIMEQKDSLDFMFSGTVSYENSRSLRCIKEYTPFSWNDSK